MIFVTVGTQLAFDRLVQAVDLWAGHNPGVPTFAQVGPTAAPPRHMPWADFVPPARADELMRQCDLVVAHAGMGSILMALQYQRPIVIMPRDASLREHRNDHQLATARWLADRPGITVAWSPEELGPMLDRRDSLHAGPPMPAAADGALVDRVARFVRGE